MSWYQSPPQERIPMWKCRSSSLESRLTRTSSAASSTSKKRRKYTPWPWDNAQRSWRIASRVSTPDKIKGQRGIPTKILRSEKGKQKAGHDKARKRDLQWLDRGTQGSHLRRGNGIPSESIHHYHQGPDKLFRAEVLQYSGHPDRNRASEGCRDTNPHLKNGYRCGSVEAPPWKVDWHVHQAQPAVPPKKGENILRGPGTMHRGHEESPQGWRDLRRHWWRFQRHPSPPTDHEHQILIRVKILPCTGHPHGTKKILQEPSINIIIVRRILRGDAKSERRYLSLWQRHKKSSIPIGKIT